MNDEIFMKVALEEAKLTKGLKRFGAVIVRDGKIVARAHTTVYEENDPTKHAEILAISKASKLLKTKDLTGCTLYSTCEPCMMCTGAALWAKINEVIYAMSREDAREMFHHSAHWHLGIEQLVPKGFKIRKGILRKQAKESFVPDN